MAGLLDQHHFAGSALAFTLVQKMAAWVHSRVEAVISGPGGMALWQRVLGTEWGGVCSDVALSPCKRRRNSPFVPPCVVSSDGRCHRR
eukprot:SAG11_NODE_1194_length_5548_cov_3.456414_4_plen_88_part_00